MSEELIDDSTINKLIPQIFDQMKSNFDATTTTMGSRTRRDTTNFSMSSSFTSTQSLLKELESLDKIIGMIENVDKTLKSASPQHLNRIYEVCKSTNTILDSWIDIQSQAGYITRLMNDPVYLKYSSDQLFNDDNADEYLALEVEETEKLKKQIEIEQQRKLLATTERQTLSNSRPQVNVRSRTHVSKPVVRRPVPTDSRGNRPKPSGIPTIPTRLARSTASSSRKMFR
ncbi:Duo1p NDAI_0I01700 [Naumovozyma dairenensis CBS 421]|uniref:DASH complex subunit DUO1 n=1 Tax=Naumovozyma dairenensis (strain ATCC 10597 / BCRC 20456 / CBS 421 / NBRC 0211 / NRRL Y-12639) TaxID=1071378 RepID=G0WG28_NAUDC|nr:hypothetical protein NDAI_0I01700 [Naumovozyma dairenensis CBS 421]CCD26739.1 hypothetical protein NDAI_0I01700 [Naumovozyma dairenensis CBS 421]